MVISPLGRLAMSALLPRGVDGDGGAGTVAGANDPAGETPAMASEGVVFDVDLAGRSGDIVALVFLILMACSFCLTAWTLKVVVQQYLKNRSHFWRASVVGVALLLPVPLFEIGFTLSMWSKQTLFGFPPYITLIGDVLVRTGYATVTILRFWRLKLIYPAVPTRSRRLFRVAAGIIVIATAINLYSASSLRIIETITGEYGVVSSESKVLEVQEWRARDTVIGGITFLIVHLSNLAADVLFYHTIVTRMSKALGSGRVGTAGNAPSTVRGGSAYASVGGDSAAGFPGHPARKRTSRMTRSERIATLLPYLPPLITTSLYILSSMTALLRPSTPQIFFTAIALNRLAPAVETFSFYVFSVNQTRRLLRLLNVTRSSGEGGAGVGGGTGAGGHHISHTETGSQLRGTTGKPRGHMPSFLSLTQAPAGSTGAGASWIPPAAPSSPAAAAFGTQMSSIASRSLQRGASGPRRGSAGSRESVRESNTSVYVGQAY